MAIQALLVILAVLLVLLFLGVPISYAIAVSSLTAILSSIDLNVAVLTAAQRTFVGMSKFSLTAIPFFILAGNIMNQGGIAKRLVDFVMAILGKLPGALLVTNIGTNALFGAISGSASAAAAAVGSMIRDGADEQGYDPAVTAATNAASSCSGLLIPPSNALITYSLASGGTSAKIQRRLWPVTFPASSGRCAAAWWACCWRSSWAIKAPPANLTGKTSASAPCALCLLCP